MKEANVVEAIRKAIVKAHPWAWVLKTHGGPYQVPGIPDLLVVVDGLMFGFEVKHQRPGESAEHVRGRATTQQLRQIALLRAAGATAAVVLGADECLALIDEAARSRVATRPAP